MEYARGRSLLATSQKPCRLGNVETALLRSVDQMIALLGGGLLITTILGCNPIARSAIYALKQQFQAYAKQQSRPSPSWPH